jgi:uncharacterized membrane protein YgaE (UPF0421/DUF939 family)
MSTRDTPSSITGNHSSEIGRNAARLTWRPIAVHSARTAIAAIASLMVARLFLLPEAYWAPITTLVITQSSLGSALAVSGERFAGTVLGALVGAIVASRVAGNVLVFGASVFILGLITAAMHFNRSAYRFAGVTVGIVLLLPREGPAWHIAFNRFAEVSIGLCVALILTMLWPEQEETRSL